MRAFIWIENCTVVIQRECLRLQHVLCHFVEFLFCCWSKVFKFTLCIPCFLTKILHFRHRKVQVQRKRVRSSWNALHVEVMRNDLVSVFNICHQAYALGEKGFKVEVFLFFPLASHTLHLIRILWLSVRFIIIAVLILYNTGNWLVFFFQVKGRVKRLLNTRLQRLL